MAPWRVFRIFERTDFEAEFPLARMRFAHPNFPGEVEMLAFNPFIPTNEDDRSLPAAFFSLTVTNTTGRKLRYTVAFSCNNNYAGAKARHSFGSAGGFKHIFLDSGENPNDAGYGNLCIAGDCPDISYQEFWYRGNFFDNVNVFWQDFTRHGPLKNRSYEEARPSGNAYTDFDVATLAAHVELKPGETRELRFVLSWSMPWMQNTWEITNTTLSDEEKKARAAIKWKNHYATRFQTAKESARYALDNFDRLYGASAEFSRLIHRSSLPPEALEAVITNLAVLKSPTCLRLEDGSL